MKTFQQFIEENESPSNVSGSAISTDNPKVLPKKYRDDDEEENEDDEEDELEESIFQDITNKYNLEIKRIIRTLDITESNIVEKEAVVVKKLQQMGLSYSDAMLLFNRVVNALGAA